MEELKVILKLGGKALVKFFKILRIAFLVIAVYVIVISLFFYFAKKEQAKYNLPQRQKQMKEQLYKDFFLNYEKLPEEERKVLDLYRATACFTTGNLCSKDPSESFEYFKQSLLGKLTSLITLPYSTPPASGIAWTVNTLANIGVVPKAVAAPVGGIGLNAISPFYPIWSLFRNIAYLAVVLLLLTIGFLIMLRTKINPQTVIGIENSLPKIIVSLILITLSFPIAGFLIDLMYIFTLLVIFMLYPQDANFAIQQSNIYLTGGFKNLLPPGTWGFAYNPYAWTVALNLPKILPGILYWGIHFLGTTVLFILSAGIRRSALKDLPKDTANEASLSLLGINPSAVKGALGLIGEIISIISILTTVFFSTSIVTLFIYLSILLSILFTMFKLFFLLLFTYLRVIINLIFSPLYMLLESIPGKSGATNWIKNMFIELLTFPLVVLFILLAKLVMELNLPPEPTPWTPPFLYGIDQNAITYLVGLGIFLMSPGLIRQIKKSLGAAKPLVDLNLKTFLFGGGALVGGFLGGVQMGRSYLALMPESVRKSIGSLKGLGGLLVPKDPVVESIEKLAQSIQSDKKNQQGS